MIVTQTFTAQTWVFPQQRQQITKALKSLNINTTWREDNKIMSLEMTIEDDKATSSNLVSIGRIIGGILTR